MLLQIKRLSNATPISVGVWFSIPQHLEKSGPKCSQRLLKVVRTYTITYICQLMTLWGVKPHLLSMSRGGPYTDSEITYELEWLRFQPVRSSDAYMRQRYVSSSSQVMVLLKATPTYCQLDSEEQTTINFYQENRDIYFTNICLKESSTKYRPSCLAWLWWALLKI